MLTPKTLTPEERHDIVRRVKDDAVLSVRYTTLLALSTIIAAFGLLVDSTAVVIGAMIIAPLMGPILGLSLGMVRGARELQRAAIVAEVVGVALCMAIAFLIGLLPYTLGISGEMLARTQPTTFDIGIALASGLAGAYASVNTKVSSTIAGVAISVALVPPLASSGLLFAMGRADLAFGAFLLWFVNFLAIQVAAAGVYSVFGFSRMDASMPEGRRRWFWRFGPSVLALVLVGWFLTSAMLKFIEVHRVEQKCEEVLSAQIARRSGGRLDELIRVERVDDGWSIVASALTPQPFEAAQVAQIEAELQRRGVPKPRLVLRSLVSQDVSSKGKVYLSQGEVVRSREAAREAAVLESVRAAVAASLSGHEAIEIQEVQISSDNGEQRVTAVVRSPAPVEPDEVAATEAAVRAVIGQDLRLVVRSISTRDADRDGFLYQAPVEHRDEEIESMRALVGPILDRRVSDAGMKLREFSLSKAGDLIRAVAIVESPTPVNQSLADDLESDLRQFIEPRLRLAIQTMLVVRAAPRAAPDGEQ